MKMANRKGFTMVELLIVLAIIAILAAVAIPVYSSQLENARKEVDNSNLRAATGLAAQDYILREAGTTGATTERFYVVLALESSNQGAVKSQNMLVYPVNGRVDTDGTWYEGTSGMLPSNKQLAVTINNINNANSVVTMSKNSNNTITGGKPIVLPLQQNGGNARFVIKIGKGGVVSESKIITGNNSTSSDAKNTLT